MPRATPTPTATRSRTSSSRKERAEPSLRRRLQASLFDQRLDLRVAAAEGAIERRGVLRSAPRKDHLAEALAVGAGHAAVLPEPVVGVVVDHLAPEVGVVAGRIAARPDVREVRRVGA